MRNYSSEHASTKSVNMKIRKKQLILPAVKHVVGLTLKRLKITFLFRKNTSKQISQKLRDIE